MDSNSWFRGTKVFLANWRNWSIAFLRLKKNRNSRGNPQEFHLFPGKKGFGWFRRGVPKGFLAIYQKQEFLLPLSKGRAPKLFKGLFLNIPGTLFHNHFGPSSAFKSNLWALINGNLFGHEFFPWTHFKPLLFLRP